MTADLLPCPFCGGDADISHDHTVEENHGYGCRVCDIWFDGANSDDPVAAWNRRAPASAEMGNPISASAVKPLEWNEYESEGSIDRWDAEAGQFGVFYSIEIQFGGFRTVFDHEAVGSIGEFPTLEAAKAAAQADYEARILSALQTGDA